jgi:hypothetical protein
MFIRRPISRQQWKLARRSVSVNRPPAETRVPADRLEHERREHVHEVVVRDLEAAVDPVHLPERALSRLAVVAVLEDRADDQVGVVVALLRRARELAGRVEQASD